MEEVTPSNPEPKAGGKNMVTVGLVLLGALAVAGAVFMMRGPGESETDMDADMMGAPRDEKADMTQQPGDSAKMSFEDLLSMGKSQKCTFSDGDNQMKSEGTFYMSGNKGRAMITSTVSGDGSAALPTVSNMIFDTGAKMAYFWDETTKRGMKMSMDQPSSPEVEKGAREELSAPSGADVPASDLDREYSYDCDSWKADESMFTLPSGVVFTDATEMMKAFPKPETVPGNSPPGAPTPAGGMTPPGAKDMKALQCAACEQAGEQQAACKKGLGCE